MAFWHEVLALAMWRHRGTGYHTLVSYSYDGELAARVIRWFGLRTLRGSSSRGGSEALRQMELALQKGITVGFTLDGPRGPRREAKPGIAILSGRAQVPAVPCAFAVDRAWRLRSWDRFVVPKPFARILCVCGPAIPPPKAVSSEAVEQHRRLVEETLNALQASVDRELEASTE